MAELGLGNLANYGLDVDYSHNKEITSGLQLGMNLAKTQQDIQESKAQIQQKKAEVSSQNIKGAFDLLGNAGKMKDKRIASIMVKTAQERLVSEGIPVGEGSLEFLSSADAAPYISMINRDPNAADNPEVMSGLINAAGGVEEAVRWVNSAKDRQQRLLTGLAGATSRETIAAANNQAKLDAESGKQSVEALKIGLTPAQLADISGRNGPEKEAAAQKDPRVQAVLDAQLGAVRAKETGTVAQQTTAGANVTKAETGVKAQAATERDINSKIQRRTDQTALDKERIKLAGEANKIRAAGMSARTSLQEKRLFGLEHQRTYKNLEPTSKVLGQADIDLKLFDDKTANGHMSKFSFMESTVGLQRILKGSQGVLTNSEYTRLEAETTEKMTQWESKLRQYTGNPMKTPVSDELRDDMKHTFTRLYNNLRIQYDAKGNALIANQVAGKIFTPAEAKEIKANLSIRDVEKQGMLETGGASSATPATTKIAPITAPSPAFLQQLAAKPLFQSIPVGQRQQAIDDYLKNPSGFNASKYKGGK